MRILHVIRDLSPATGGPVTALKGLAASQASLGHDVVVATTDFGLDTPPSIKGADLRVFPSSSGAWRWSSGMRRALPLLVQQADIVHIHMVWEYTALAAALMCRKLGTPFILRPCGLLDVWALEQNTLKKRAYLKVFRKFLIDGASGIHYTTRLEYERSVYREQAGRSFIIPIGLSDEAPGGDDCSRGLNARFPELEGKRAVLFLGRLHPKKNPDIAIEAFAAIAERYPDAHLVMAGPGEQKYIDDLAVIVKERSIAGRVTFTGMLDRSSVAEAYARADVFLLPSHLENFGISVAEAMKYGCPVIVSDQVYLAPDILEAGAGLVCSLDAGEFSSSLDQVLRDPDARSSFGRRGRQLAAEKYEWTTIVQQLDAVYGDILSNRRTSHVWA